MPPMLAEAPRGEVEINVRGNRYRADWEVRDGALAVTAELGARVRPLAGLERMPDTLARLTLLELVKDEAQH